MDYKMDEEMMSKWDSLMGDVHQVTPAINAIPEHVYNISSPIDLMANIKGAALKSDTEAIVASWTI